MFKGIVYCATSPSGKKYYGITTNSLESRIKSHKKSYIKKKTAFYDAIRKYGWDNINWKIVEIFENTSKIDLGNKLKEREKYWIETDKTNISRYGDEYGYNLTDGGDGAIGYKYTDEQRKIASQRVSNTNNPMFGKKHSIESIEKNRKSNSGKHHTEETKKKMSESHKGFKHTEEYKLKMSQLHKNKLVSIDTRKKISNSRKGKKVIHSAETKKKMSESQKGKIQKIVFCKYCGKKCSPSTLSRWHNINCKFYNFTLNTL